MFRIIPFDKIEDFYGGRRIVGHAPAHAYGNKIVLVALFPIRPYISLQTYTGFLVRRKPGTGQPVLYHVFKFGSLCDTEFVSDMVVIAVPHKQRMPLGRAPAKRELFTECGIKAVVRMYARPKVPVLRGDRAPPKIPSHNR